LLVLLVTTRRQRAASPRRRRRLLQRESTNLHHLRREPHRVLLTSLLWLDDTRWWPYLVTYLLVVAPAERRMGSWRWLGIGSAAHVGATVVSQGLLRRRIRRSAARRRYANARDVGVSYFLLGIVGALSGYLVRPWRLRTQGALTAALALNVAVRPTFTEVGHLSAFAIGLVASTLVPDTAEKPYPALRHNIIDESEPVSVTADAPQAARRRHGDR
jgi:hypothetical protein